MTARRRARERSSPGNEGEKTMLWFEILKAEIARDLIGLIIGGIVLFLLWLFTR